MDNVIIRMKCPRDIFTLARLLVMFHVSNYYKSNFTSMQDENWGITVEQLYLFNILNTRFDYLISNQSKKANNIVSSLRRNERKK